MLCTYDTYADDSCAREGGGVFGGMCCCLFSLVSLTQCAGGLQLPIDLKIGSSSHADTDGRATRSTFADFGNHVCRQYGSRSEGSSVEVLAEHVSKRCEEGNEK